MDLKKVYKTLIRIIDLVNYVRVQHRNAELMYTCRPMRCHEKQVGNGRGLFEDTIAFSILETGFERRTT
jgi:hypothetical protein